MDEQVERTSGAGSARRMEIIDAAVSAFADAGLDGTTLQEIARAAGVTVATVSYHFSSKDQLFDEALGLVLDDLNSVIEAARPTAQETDAKGLDAVVDAVWDWFDGNPLSARLYQLHLQALTGGSRVLRDEFVALHVRRAFQYLPPSRGSASSRLAAQTLALRSLIAALNMVAGAQADGPLADQSNDFVRRTMRGVARQLITG